MISKRAVWLSVGISFVLLTWTPVAAQVVDGSYRIFRPDGPGRIQPSYLFPAAADLRPLFALKAYERPAEQLRGMGFVVVWADYLGRRNLKSCSGGGITPDEAGRDAVTAASWLRSQSYVDAKRITAIGWSYGGNAVLAALSSHSVDQLIFTGAILYYPACAGVGQLSNPIPVLVLRGVSDNVAPHSLCESALRTGSGKANVKIIDYPGAYHIFDWPELPPKMEYPFGTVGYHPQAAAAAWEEVKKFLQAGR